VKPGITPQATADAVLAVLGGTPLHEAAARIAIDPADLADAAELYQAAGLAALHAKARVAGWYQVRIEFTDWDTAEHAAATCLWPQLQRAEAAGTISSWWFTRKAPCWRFRFQPGRAAALADLTTFLSRILETLLAQGTIAEAQETIYEPEACAFGGPEGMDIAHQLFRADSRNILSYLSRSGPAVTPGRRELSILLCSALMRGAGQDWYEQGDIWKRVVGSRPAPPGTPLERQRDITPALRRLMTVDAGAASNLVNDDGGALAFAADWTGAFEHAGTALGNAARDGKLGRGLRDILAHHVIFHWNRIGLSLKTQSILATAATDAVFGKVPWRSPR
jgi:thiopeptide-type bacteriocin biosynthesis protein